MRFWPANELLQHRLVENAVILTASVGAPPTYEGTSGLCELIAPAIRPPGR